MMPATPAAAAVQIRQHLLSISSSSSACCRLRLPARPRAAPPSMSAEARPAPSPVAVPPPAHPTYDLSAVITLALSEDAGDRGDVSCLATIPIDVNAEATFIAKEDGVIAGISLADMILKQVDPSLKVEWFEDDGNFVHKGLQFGKVYGCAQSIIVAERVVLNFMQRMSGIATMTKAMADAARPACILETRKTAPGLRLVDKWAVLIGGGKNHRLGLFDMVMIKDNHISVAGGITNAMTSVDQFLEKEKLAVPVEVETRTLEEVRDLLKYSDKNKTSLTRIMLDNMVVPLPNGDIDVSMLKDAVQLINGRFETEASGNVTMDTVKKIGETGVTYISSGALTHSVKALDISLKIDTELALQVGRRTNRAWLHKMLLVHGSSMCQSTTTSWLSFCTSRILVGRQATLQLEPEVRNLQFLHHLRPTVLKKMQSSLLHVSRKVTQFGYSSSFGSIRSIHHQPWADDSPPSPSPTNIRTFGEHGTESSE